MELFETSKYIQIAQSTGVFSAEELKLLEEVIGEARGTNTDEYYIVNESVNAVLAGFCLFTRIPITAFAWDICWIVSGSQFQRMGIGGKLVKKTEEFVLNHNNHAIIRIETSSKAEYLPARNLYLKHGYTQIHRYPNFYAKGDDMVTFSKEITAPQIPPPQIPY